MLQVGLVAENFDEVEFAFVWRGQLVAGEAELDLLAFFDCDDPSAVQRHVVGQCVVENLLGYVFAAKCSVQAAQFKATFLSFWSLAS